MFFRLRMIYRFLFDRTIPFKEKLWIILPLIYILSPIDLIPAPVLGFSIVDDLVMFIFLMSMVKNRLDKHYNNKEQKVDEEKIIDFVEYKVEKEEDDD